jgi:hypothetical protein
VAVWIVEALLVAPVSLQKFYMSLGGMLSEGVDGAEVKRIERSNAAVGTVAFGGILLINSKENISKN